MFKVHNDEPPETNTIFETSKISAVLANYDSLTSHQKFERLLELRLLKDENKNNEITVHYAICYYYLSGYYFRRSSRPRSYSFQLRKILYTIRLVINDVKAEQISTIVSDANDELITFINNFFVRKILQIKCRQILLL